MPSSIHWGNIPFTLKGTLKGICKGFDIEKTQSLIMWIDILSCPWALVGSNSLTILTGKDWCFTQFGTGMAGWLLLIFLICLHNQ